MGCMEHTCVECNEIDINNNPNVQNCPKCGEPMYRDCDEDPERPCNGDDIDESGEPL